MQIRKKAIAGTMESSDAMVTVLPAEELAVQIDSVVLAQYGQQIEAVVRGTLERLDVRCGEVLVDDHGAVDCVLAARVETAVRRARGGED